ncbi:MAG: ABC transporter permease [Candidatus Krumholzibacteria bacterium]|nr:ABC transporter permease [Candidatus Krumholzibacteria bacterium]
MVSSTPVLSTPDRKKAIAGVAADAVGCKTGSVVRTTSGRKPASRRRIVLMLDGDKTATSALVLILVLIICAVFAPLLSPYHPDATNLNNRLDPPSLQHPFGTDDMGTDLFVRVMAGGRVSLAVGILAMILAVSIGVVGGAISAFWGGWVDSIVMRATDLMLSIPVFFIVLLVASLITPGVVTICLLIGITQWMDVARVVRSVVLSAKQSPFAEAARALGVPGNRILFRHILLHTSGPVLVAATIGVAHAMIMESALSFLGFGVQPPAASWGSMLRNAQSHLGPAPWTAIFPGLMIFLTVLCCHAVSDFLRSVLEPQSN